MGSDILPGHRSSQIADGGPAVTGGLLRAVANYGALKEGSRKPKSDDQHDLITQPKGATPAG